MTEQEAVKKCLIEIYKKNGYEDITVLTQRDYEHVSGQIEKNTGILISVSTLKRLLHGEFTRLPQTATLNAISRYLGYSGWQDYKSSSRNDPAPVRETHENKQNDTAGAFRVKPARFKLIVSFTLVAAAVIGSILFIRYSAPNTISHADKAAFSVRKITSNEIPNTVVFTYDVDNVHADSFFIQQSWDRNKRVRVYKNQHTLTDIYYEPGYHVAKLIAGDSIIKTIDVSIPTDRWFFLAKDNAYSRPAYIKKSTSKTDGSLTLEKQDLAASQIDMLVEKEYAYLYFPSAINVSSDNYNYKSRIRMKAVRNNFCPYVMIEIFCQRNFMFFKSMSKGCAGESDLEFGEHYISGKNNDLSPLSADVAQWLDVEVSVRNKHVAIKLNGAEAFSMQYNDSSGLITGLGFISNGLCEIDLVDLKGTDGKVIYEDNF